MADLAYDALAIWDELERDAGTSLRTMSGLLNFGDKDYGGNTPEGKIYCPRETCSWYTGTLTGPEKNLKRHEMEYKICAWRTNLKVHD